VVVALSPIPKPVNFSHKTQPMMHQHLRSANAMAKVAEYLKDINFGEIKNI
jgi:hypothetical protein